ncbi:MAG: transglutaminase domain-containing protein [Candidatus Krumholzibacteriota bacterium]|nr:transglutaminase domain-containing protein [Candidatus Krumholzibacteriota bacterium]
MKRPMITVIVFVTVFISSLVAGCGPKTVTAGDPSAGSQLNDAVKEADTYYYAVKLNDVIGGYVKFSVTEKNIEGRKTTFLNEYLFMMISALGAQFNTELTLNYHIDQATGRFIYHDSKVDQGDLHLSSKIFIEGNRARFSSDESEEDEYCDLPADVILESTLFFPHLKKDFVDEALEEKTYNIYEVRENEVQETVYTKKGIEKLELAGKEYEAVILDELNLKTGIKVTWWIDSETGLLLIANVPGNRQIFLADENVIKIIELANLDESIMTKANVSIADIQAISYMKVEAVIEPVGLWVTEEGLNVAGQRFEGRVEENLIEGVFEIEHIHYDGSGAPPFPPDFSADKDVAGYLKPSDFAESDDPVLVAKAAALTEGSKDSWEAAVRLSRWVADNISYAIPGGGTARKTYVSKAGECGAHSLLLASFCRGVGIPARVVWGCMYVPNFGGAFGQHAWTEIYMGDAGWIPVDATAFEADFVDSGHIRIGEYQSPSTALNAKRIKILDHRTGSGEEAEDEDGKYEIYTGDYTGPRGAVFKVLVQNGSLGVDIPGQIVLTLHEADEEGRRYAKLSNRIFVTFDGEREGEVRAMLLHELLLMPKRSEPDSIAPGIQAELIPLMGMYFLAQAQAEFTVSADSTGRLSVHSTIDDKKVSLKPLDTEGRYIDEFDKNIFSFIKDDTGKVSSIELEAINRFEK